MEKPNQLSFLRAGTGSFTQDDPFPLPGPGFSDQGQNPTQAQPPGAVAADSHSTASTLVIEGLHSYMRRARASVHLLQTKHKHSFPELFNPIGKSMLKNAIWLLYKDEIMKTQTAAWLA